MKLSDLKNIDVEAVASAIEADAGEPVPDIREALAEVKAGVAGRVTTPEQILLRQARKATGLSQSEFAKRIETPVATLRDWEQGRFTPPGAVKALARLIARHPQWADELAVA
ncbi:MAG: helix-turn-helix domain-containing protein [Desulfobulbus sp.]|nr:helix-turn-helix domain-containing protein [Desulfobulbus sp.]